MSSQSSNTPAHKSEPPYYTNEDIAILHDIVLHAEELLAIKPERDRIPTTALFEAYYSILPQLGRNADHDSRYARVLFKIGGRRGHGSLYEKFEDVLLQMDIHIQFDYLDDEEDPAEEPAPKVADVEPSFSSATNATNGHQLDDERKARPQRRDSESSVHPAGYRRAGERKLRPRATSFEPSPRPILPSAALIAERDLPQAGPSNSQRGTHLLTDRRTKEIEAWMSPILNGTKIKLGSEPSTGAVRYAPKPRIIPENASYQASDLSVLPKPPSRNLPPPQYTPSEQYELAPHHINLYLESKAEYDARLQGLQEAMQISLARKMLVKWRGKCSEQVDYEAKAVERRKYGQLKYINGVLQGRQKQRDKVDHELRNYQYGKDCQFVHLCFGQWANRTWDAIEQAMEARSYVRRRRIFKGWYDHVVSKQINTRRHVLSLFFNSWHRRCIGEMGMATNLVMFQNERLKRIVYMWFLSIVIKRMRKSEATSFELCSLQLLADKAADYRMAIATADHIYSKRLKQSVLGVWVKRGRDVKALKIHSSLSDEQKLQRQVLHSWSHLRRLNEPAWQVRRNANARICHTVLARWRSQTEQLTRASRMDVEKVKKEAWVTWTDHCQSKRLQGRADLRAKSEVFRKWLLATKCKKMVNKRMTELLRTSFHRLRGQAHHELEMRASVEKQVSDSRAHMLRSSALYKWRSLSAVIKTQREIASEVSNVPIKRDCFKIWKQSARSKNQKQQWAGDAEFYYRARRTMGKWRASTAQSKKRRLHDAYSHSRRNNKLKLAAGMLTRWRQKTRLARENTLLAAESSHGLTMKLSQKVVNNWRDRRTELQLASVRFSSLQVNKISSQWRAKLGSSMHRSGLAVEFSDRSLQARSLKKWKRERLRDRAHGFLVVELQEKHDKRLLRSIVSYWREAYLRKQKVVESFEEPTAVAPSPRPVPKAAIFAQSLRQSAVAMDNSKSVASALPPYLNTPSRRTLLARTMANAMTTTPSARLSTTLERQLRAQLTGNSLSAYARRHVERQPSNLRGFEDLREDEEVDEP